MDNEKIEKVIAVLDGITYNDWVKLKTAVDNSFNKIRFKAEKEFRLESDDVPTMLRSQFGCVLD